ncbi:MAG: OmpA family protein [Thiotrichales bacterium]
MNSRLLPIFAGLVAFALLAYFCSYRHTARIEAELQDATRQALDANGLSWANAATSGRDVTLTGNAPDAAARKLAGDAVVAIPGINGVKNRIEVSRNQSAAVQSTGPYSATITLRDDLVTLSGAIPSDATRQSLLQVARARFGGTNVIDRLEVQPGAPPKFVLAFEEAVLQQIDGFIEGKGTVTDNLIELDGVVRGANDGERLQAVVSLAVPRDYSLRFNARVIDQMTTEELAALSVTHAATCQARLDVEIASAQIRFDTGKALITPDTIPLLERVANIARACRDSRIEVAGHTDNTGSAESNRRLSQSRADSVRAFLIRQGLDAERLSTKGYGATRPIADNASPAGQAANRRIEFIIQGN